MKMLRVAALAAAEIMPWLSFSLPPSFPPSLSFFPLLRRPGRGDVRQPVQGDVCGRASQQPRGVPVRGLQLGGQGLGLSLRQGQSH